MTTEWLGLRSSALEQLDARIGRCTSCGGWTYSSRPCTTCGPTVIPP